MAVDFLQLRNTFIVSKVSGGSWHITYGEVWFSGKFWVTGLGVGAQDLELRVRILGFSVLGRVFRV